MNFSVPPSEFGTLAMPTLAGSLLYGKFSKPCIVQKEIELLAANQMG